MSDTQYAEWSGRSGNAAIADPHQRMLARFVLGLTGRRFATWQANFRLTRYQRWRFRLAARILGTSTVGPEQIWKEGK